MSFPGVPPSAARTSSSAASASLPARSSSTVDPRTVPSRSKTTAVSTWVEISVRSASAWAVAATGPTLPQPILRSMPALPEPLGKFFRDRGPHLAAMTAYFALLSFVPLLFLTGSLLGLAGRPDESSYLVTELKRAFPGSSVASIVHTVREIQKHATARRVELPRDGAEACVPWKLGREHRPHRPRDPEARDGARHPRSEERRGGK